MSTQDNERKTQIIAVGIIVIAAVIGISSIIAALYVASSRKKAAEAVVSEQNENIATEESESLEDPTGGSVTGLPQPTDDFDPEGDEKLEYEDPAENPDDGMSTPDDKPQLLGGDKEPDKDSIDEEPDEEIDSDSDDKSDGSIGDNGEGSDFLTPDLSVNFVLIRPILDSCYVSGTEFDKDSLLGTDSSKRGGKSLKNDENTDEFSQCIFTDVKEQKITDDCLYRYAANLNITDVESAIEAFNLDFSKANNFGDECKMIRIFTDMGPGMAVLSNDMECLSVYLSEGVESHYEGAEERTLIIEIQEFKTNIGNSTFMSVGFWW